VAGTFNATGVPDPQVSTSIPPGGGDLILSDGRVHFAGPWHDIDGPAAVTGTTVTFARSPPGWPARAEDQQRSETDVVRLLAGPVKATVTAASLRLEHPDGTGVGLVEADSAASINAPRYRPRDDPSRHHEPRR